jgi:hypothetical protein
VRGCGKHPVTAGGKSIEVLVRFRHAEAKRHGHATTFPLVGRVEPEGRRGRAYARWAGTDLGSLLANRRIHGIGAGPCPCSGETISIGSHARRFASAGKLSANTYGQARRRLLNAECWGYLRWKMLRMLPSLSVNQAAFPTGVVAMPFSVLRPGKSYSTKTMPRPWSSLTSAAMSSVPQPI